MLQNNEISSGFSAPGHCIYKAKRRYPDVSVLLAHLLEVPKTPYKSKTLRSFLDLLKILKNCQNSKTSGVSRDSHYFRSFKHLLKLLRSK